MNGAVFYRGPSLLTGDPIVGIVTLRSLNTKTGDMAQAWILREGMTPTDAVALGFDDAVCGDCVHRSGSNVGRSCYVVWWLGPLNVYKAYDAGAYEDLGARAISWRYLRDRFVRLGAYGDPAAIPIKHWQGLTMFAAGWTGYTQQWRSCAPAFAELLMASVNSPAEADDARRRGWRTFRVRQFLDGAGPRPDEIVCPASNEAGHRTTCARCRLCQGTSRPTGPNVVILAHGQRAEWFGSLSRAQP